MKKTIQCIICITAFAFTCSFPGFAGVWRTGNGEHAGRWWYDNEDGTFLRNGWQWLDGNQDGIAECYYFDEEGWMAAGTITADGYQVDENGAWIEHGAIQTKNIGQLEEIQREEELRLTITVNGQKLTASMIDNETTRSLMNRMPMTVEMRDLYDREMCYVLPETLPVNEAKVTGYEAGDIVYWPPGHCLVILYAQNGEHFQMQKLGHIESGVEIFDGVGDVKVTFEK